MAKHITFVKKILANGEPCKKCKEVEDRLIQSGYMSAINQTIIADERNPQSPGMLLAKQHNVQLAPFFIIEEGSATRIYTIYLKFVKAELDQTAKSTRQDSEDILRNNPDLDFL